VEADQTTILVADDEPAIRLLCRVNLEFEGYRVLEADTLEAARSELDRENVDVMLIDVRFGEHDGRDLVREIRSQGRPLPIALLTGSVTLRADERGGADELIEKPFALETLLDAVRRLEAGGLPAGK
jgi:two-component system, OmpR family, phosphate regulon response regulator PhoB